MSTSTAPLDEAPVVTAEAKISLRGVTRRFGDVVAVDAVTLDIEDGEFVVLLGPSGCGKSTLLRMIAGLQTVSDGVIAIEGREAQHMEPDERDLAFVFQNYALYPHMTVRRNLSFPLLMARFRWWHHIPIVGSLMRRHIERQPEIAERIEKIAKMLDLDSLLHRVPATLSGGQRQRVALGRAMVREPLAFLMDEPLSNLDAKLRAQTRAELTQFHKVLGATIVYVTHDQVEAMTMGDKIGVMEGGQLKQFGRPREIYEKPADTFVAQFVGTPAMNILPASAVDAETWEVGGQRLVASRENAGVAMRSTTSDGGFLLGLRSEWTQLSDSWEEGLLRGTVVASEDWGAEQLVRVELDDHGHREEHSLVDPGRLVVDVRAPSNVRVTHGDPAFVRVLIEYASLFDKGSGVSLLPASPTSKL